MKRNNYAKKEPVLKGLENSQAIALQKMMKHVFYIKGVARLPSYEEMIQGLVRYLSISQA